MAGGPTVTLTFAGDATKLNKAFDGVGSSAKKMSDNVGSSSRDIREHIGGGFDAVGDKADDAEGKFQGFADTITGFGDVAQGFKDGDVAVMAAGFASLAGGFAQLLPMMGPLITATWGFTTALLANPITWIVIGIVALITVIVLLITHWDDVKKVVGIVVDWIKEKWNQFTGWIGEMAAKIGQWFADLWQGIKDKAGSAKDWVVSKFQGMVDWFAGLPGKIGGFFTSIGDGIKNAFRSAFNFVARAWNSTVGKIGFNVPSWVPGVGGKSFSVPDIPTFHTGGIVPGVPGSETLALLQAGERVTPASQVRRESGAVTVSFAGNTDAAFAAAFMKMVRTGQIQLQAS